MRFQIRRATIGDLGAVSELFDQYRQFYGQSADYELAEGFLRERLDREESVVFVAVYGDTGAGIGFAQLYPSFSSAAARRIWILNDLFVAPAFRRQGVARALLEAARKHGLVTGAKRLVLSTAATNQEAQELYESSGYQRETVFIAYKLEL